MGPVFFFFLGFWKEQSFEQCLAIIKIYKEPIFQTFLNQRTIGSVSVGDGSFRIREPRWSWLCQKPLKTLKERMLFTKDLGKNWQQVSGSYQMVFFCNKFENNNRYRSEHHSFIFLWEPQLWILRNSHDNHGGNFSNNRLNIFGFAFWVQNLMIDSALQCTFRDIVMRTQKLAKVWYPTF